MQRNAVSILAHARQLAGIIRYSRGFIDMTKAAGPSETACDYYGDINAHQWRPSKISR